MPFSSLRDFIAHLESRHRLVRESVLANMRKLFLAMRQVAETGKGPQEQVPSMGCSIKWREAA